MSLGSLPPDSNHGGGGVGAGRNVFTTLILPSLARPDFVGSDPVGSDTVGSDPIGSDTAGNGVQKEQASSSPGPTPGPSPITPVTEPDRPAPPSRSPPSASPAVALGPSTECVTAYDYLSANGTFTEFLQIVEVWSLQANV